MDRLKDKVIIITGGYHGIGKAVCREAAGEGTTIAAAFYPDDVIVRMSDFKTNEYAYLVGGHYFEPAVENPMIGYPGSGKTTHCRKRG